MNSPSAPLHFTYKGRSDGSSPQRVATVRGAEVIRNAFSMALGMGERIVVVVASVTSVPPSLDLLHPAERPAVQRAVEKRVREFVAGRVLARQAARLLGLAELVLPMGRDRAPVWPGGIVGSITHNGQWCAVAMGRMHEVAGLGVDIEDHSRVSETLVARIMTSREIESYNCLGQGEQNLMRSFVFSAKEAAFKAQYNITRTMLYFLDVDARIDMDHLTFHPAYHVPEVTRKMQKFTQSCRLFHMDGIVGSAVKITGQT